MGNYITLVGLAPVCVPARLLGEMSQETEVQNSFWHFRASYPALSSFFENFPALPNTQNYLVYVYVYICTFIGVYVCILMYVYTLTLNLPCYDQNIW